MNTKFAPEFNRRQFIAAAAATAGLAPTIMTKASRVRATAGKLKVGAIGCGGRGTGAMGNILDASPDVEIVAMADAFPERITDSIANLGKQFANKPDHLSRIKVNPD